MKMFDLTGKKAIVTGGNSGYGLAIANGLREAGAEVAVLDVAGEGFSVNPRSRKSIERGFAEALDKLGTIDILINALEVIPNFPSADAPDEIWDEVMDVDMTAKFVLCQLAGRVMLEKGYGKIVNLASILSFFGGENVTAYSSAMGAVTQISKTLCNEWAGRGINVNCIAPGYLENDPRLSGDDYSRQQLLSRIPAGRWCRYEDVAGLGVFLSSSASDYINGTVTLVDGGHYVR